MNSLPDRRRRGQWVQTERAAHEAWAALIRRSPLAAQVMHILTSQVGEHNAVVISQKALAQLVGGSERGVRDALALLQSDNWIETRQIGGRGTVNAYIINDRVAWNGKRDGIRYSLFSARVILSEEEQPDRDQLDHQQPLRQQRWQRAMFLLRRLHLHQRCPLERCRHLRKRKPFYHRKIQKWI